MRSYIDEYQPFIIRQKKLKSYYDFVCGCQKCKMEGRLLAAQYAASGENEKK